MYIAILLGAHYILHISRIRVKYLFVSSLQLSNQEADCRIFGTKDVPDLDFTVKSTIMTSRREELLGRNASVDSGVHSTRSSK
jgi:hypothetical protein